MTEIELLGMLKACGDAVQRKVYQSVRNADIELLSAVQEEKKEDTIYQIDRDVEDDLVAVLDEYSTRAGGFNIIAEGIGGSEDGLQLGIDPRYAIIIDPIDGTRGIMYNK